MNIFNSTRRKEHPAKQLRRNLIHSGGVVALIALLLASSAGVTYAYWTSQATATSTIQGGQIDVTTNIDALSGFVFDNNVFTANGSFTVTNATLNTTRTMPVSSKLSAAITPVNHDANLTVAVWQNTTACTVTPIPTGATTGLWSSIDAVWIDLAPGASATFCIRVVDNARTQLGGGPGFTITPAVMSTIMPNATSGWLASASFTAATTTVPAAEKATLACEPSVDGNGVKGVKLSWGHTTAKLYDAYLVNGEVVTQLAPPLLYENNSTHMSINADSAWPSGNAGLKIRVSDAQQQSVYLEFPVKKTGGTSGNLTLECG